VWSCEICGRWERSNPIFCESCGAGAPDADGALVSLALQRDLHVEAHLGALAIWYRVGAMLTLLLAGVVLGRFGRLVVAGARSWRAVGVAWMGAVGVAVSLLLAAAAGAYYLGQRLARLHDGARIVAGAVAIAGLIATVTRIALTLRDYDRLAALIPHHFAYVRPSLAWPILAFVAATLAWIAIVATLFSTRAADVCASHYRSLVVRTPMLKPPTLRSPFFVLPLVVTVLTVVLTVSTLARLG
jgi:hypothetical protein